jgi:hypothetical protein
LIHARIIIDNKPNDIKTKTTTNDLSLLYFDITFKIAFIIIAGITIFANSPLESTPLYEKIDTLFNTSPLF